MRTPRLRVCVAAFLIPALAAALAVATTLPACSDSRSLDCASLSQQSEHLVARDGDHGGHGHHGVTMIELNETEVVMTHGTTPPSYYWHDFMESSSDGNRYPGLMGLHALFMCLAFFGALPIGMYHCRLLPLPPPPRFLMRHLPRYRPSFGQARMAWRDDLSVLGLRGARIINQCALSQTDAGHVRTSRRSWLVGVG